ncbi:MAG TPA: SRPBCC family protein [Candidatus Angelobacter sp.]|jgi:uncharacterized protein YndB with AHSA1/START domain|nr:SRPBCC family protein [Candidatus Angelobacter sp.]
MTPTTTLDLEIPAGKPIIRWSRFVSAPPELVWKAFTQAEHLRNWWGPASLTTVVCEVDLRPGGAWRTVSQAPDGSQFGFHGEYRVVDEPHRLVNTFVYEGAPDHYAVDSVTFEAVDGGTMITGHSEHDTLEARDAHVAAGMEGGMRESYDRLTAVLDALQAA